MDRHFIQDLVEENATTSVIVRSVLSIGRRRERDVIAEGLEDTPRRDGPGADGGVSDADPDS